MSTWKHAQNKHNENTNTFQCAYQQCLSELRRLWTNIPWRVACELVSQVGIHTTPEKDSQPAPTSVAQDVCVFRCNLPLAILAECLGSFTCDCGNTGMERTPGKSQHRKLTLEKKTPAGIRTRHLLITSPALYQLCYPDHVPYTEQAE